MSTITDIKQAAGYNQQSYDALIEKAKKHNVDPAKVTESLLQEIKNGKSFAEAVTQVTKDLPELKAPDTSKACKLDEWVAISSPGTLILLMIQALSADQRERNLEISAAETENVFKSMMQEASDMRTAAFFQAVVGVVSTFVTLAGAAKQLSTVTKGHTDFSAESMKGQSDLAQAQGKLFDGTVKSLDTLQQFSSTSAQAKYKEIQGDQEKMRSFRDSIKEFSNSLKETSQKALSTAESIQQGKAQAMSKILA